MNLYQYSRITDLNSLLCQFGDVFLIDEEPNIIRNSRQIETLKKSLNALSDKDIIQSRYNSYVERCLYDNKSLTKQLADLHAQNNMIQFSDECVPEEIDTILKAIQNQIWKDIGELSKRLTNVLSFDEWKEFETNQLNTLINQMQQYIDKTISQRNAKQALLEKINAFCEQVKNKSEAKVNE